jgi:hypothetical protein
LIGAGASAVLLLGVAVPALAADDATTSSEQATEQSTEESSGARTPAHGDPNCAERSSGEATPDASSDA